MSIFFKSKAQKEIEKNNARKINVLRKINNLSDDITKRGLVAIRFKLEYTKDIIDSAKGLSTNQLDLIETYVNDIQAHFEKGYADYISGRCSKIEDVIKGKNTAISPEGKAKETNEDRIAEFRANVERLSEKRQRKLEEISEIESKINKLEELQKDCLETNETEWKKYYYKISILKPDLNRLNSEIETINSQIMIENQKINSFETQNRNIERSESIRESAESASDLESQKGLVDVGVAEKNAGYSREIYEGVKSDDKKLEETINSYYADDDEHRENSADVAYQRAREQAAISSLEKKDSTASNGSKKGNK